MRVVGGLLIVVGLGGCFFGGPPLGVVWGCILLVGGILVLAIVPRPTRRVRRGKDSTLWWLGRGLGVVFGRRRLPAEAPAAPERTVVIPADRESQADFERRRAQRELIVACAAKLQGLGARQGEPMDVGTLAQSVERRLRERDPQAADYFRGLTAPEKRELLAA